MTTVFDSTRCGQRLAYDREADGYLGEHPNVYRHQQRIAERIDAEAKRHPDNSFGPKVGEGGG